MYGGVKRRDAVDRRRGGRHRRADRHLRRHSPRSPTSSPARAATPRASRTSGPGATPEPWLRGVPDPYDGAGRRPVPPLGLADEPGGGRPQARAPGQGQPGRDRGDPARRLAADRRRRRSSAPAGRTTVSGAQLQGIFGLDDTWATFTTITTTDPLGQLSGTRVPGARRRVGRRSRPRRAGAWHAVGQAPVSGRRRLQRAGAAPGATGSLAGTPGRARRHRPLQRTAAAPDSLRRRARPAAGHRRPVRPVPLVLRAAGLDHRRGRPPVNALLGAVNLILRIAADCRPRAIVVCFGAEAAAYRTELYPAYHAERPPVPDALDWQFEQAPELFAAFGWMTAVTRRPRGR